MGALLQAAQGLFWELSFPAPSRGMGVPGSSAGASEPHGCPPGTSGLRPGFYSVVPRTWLTNSTSWLSHTSFNLVRSHLFTPPGLTHWLPWGC